MKILSIELIRFKRFALNNISHFKLTADEIVQVILGTNGSGKSSMLGELTPLPAEHNAYLSGGSKVIVIDHEGSNYKLSSRFDESKKPKQTHSILKDGIELNDGGTITAQYAEVQKIFGITPEIHDLMTGKIKFTSLDAAKRRKWFTILSEVNYDYALKVFKRANDRLNEVNGGLRTAQRHLVQEQTKAAMPGEIDKLTESIKTLADEITRLYRVRSADGPTLDDIRGNITGLEKTVSAQFLKFKELKKSVSWIDFVMPEEMLEDLGEKKGRLISVNEQVQKLTTDHDRLSEELKVVQNSGNQSTTEIKIKQDILIKQKADILAQRYFDFELEDPQAVRSALTSVMEVLVDIFATLPANPEKKFNPQKRQDLRTLVDETKNILAVFEQKVSRLEHECEHMDQVLKTGMLDCPKCTHSFSPGYDMGKHEKFKSSLATGRAAVKAKKDILIKAQSDLDDLESYWAIYKDYARHASTLKLLQPMWDMHLQDDRIHNSPSSCLNVTLQFEEDVIRLLNAQIIDKELVRLDDLMVMAQRASQVDVASTSKQATVIEEELGRLAKMQLTLNREIQELQVLINAGSRVLQMEPLFREYGNTYNQLATAYLNRMANDEIDNQIRDRQIKVAQLQYRLNMFKEHACVLESVENEICSLEGQKIAMKLVVSSLSPVEGLIAEGLLGSMRSFVKKLNVVISSIWTYGMEVHACSLEADGSMDLDYKFPVTIESDYSGMGEVNLNDKPIEDVGLCSSGMKEVIDLAFKIVAMHYLGLETAPLILDEFGITFDVQHRINATHTIKNLMDQLSFSQLWLVSHYEESYTSFTNAQICVLSATNIVTPIREDYNQHTQMN